jgi:hypothetical protein
MDDEKKVAIKLRLVQRLESYTPDDYTPIHQVRHYEDPFRSDGGKIPRRPTDGDIET